MSEHALDNESRFRLLRRLADRPALSQRELAGELGISLGKVNYCLKALLDKGYIKAENLATAINRQEGHKEVPGR